MVNPRSVLVAGLIVVLAIGGFVWFNTNPTVAKSQAQGGPNSTVQPYDCPKPSANSELLCDILPANYVIAARLPNAPPAYCFNGMSDAACALLKQTQSNGVCDPNETWKTSPLDCACTGALVPDPYTGRCAAPASICLANGLGLNYVLPNILRDL
ncbi:MAG TPA: hypothetical protein VFE91_02475 [Nitrososphaerales archaeon]|nr:hypothetical protein [Nitrososphaerales archaeon]